MSEETLGIEYEELVPGRKLYCRQCGRQMIPVYVDGGYDGYTGKKNPAVLKKYKCPLYGKYRGFLMFEPKAHSVYRGGMFLEF